MTDPAQFYTGLVAELYEPLAGERARADDYVPFLERAGTPALELACGSGWPLVELAQRGYEVDGLDASAEMLARCRARAEAAGVRVQVHQAEMQCFALERRYRSMFLAGASFTLLTSDDDARSTLRCMASHLEPQGAVLIPLELPDLEAERGAIGRFRQARSEDGSELRVGMVALETRDEGRNVHRLLRYERIAADGTPEQLERDWVRRSWSQSEFEVLLRESGFEGVAFVDASGRPAEPEARFFVALARASGGGGT